MVLLQFALHGQFVGGQFSGGDVAQLTQLDCNFFTQGGENSGAVSIIQPRSITCNSFFGDEGDGFLAVELKREMECNMYMGDSMSGFQKVLVKREMECNMYMGDSHSGHYMEFYFNPAKCLMYTASVQGGSGFHWRALSQDTAVCELIPLGVEVSPLSGELMDDKAVLSWYTEREYRNSGFELYRSYDGVEWNLISWKSGKGDSDERVNYQYVDKKLDLNGQYYKFKQLDFDGFGYFSNIVRIAPDAQQLDKEIFTIYPNPTFSSGTLTLKSWNQQSREMRLDMQDAMGRVVYSVIHTFSELNKTVNVPVDNLDAGTYFIKLIALDDDLEMTLPFVVIY